MKHKTNSLSTQLRLDYRRSYRYLILLALLLPLLGQAQWSSGGSSVFLAGVVTHTSIATNNKTVYTAYRDYNSANKATVMKHTIFMSTPTINTIAGNGTWGFSGDGTAATNANLNNAAGGIAVDAAGNIYIADSHNHRIRKVATNGNISTIAGTGSPTYSGDGGAATSATLNQPAGVAVDAAGNVYIADYNNHRVRKITTNGNISTIAGTGTSGFSGDGGSATSAQLNNPYDVAVDATGNVYISDLGNQRIRKVATNGDISTFAGTGTASFFGDGGAATSAHLSSPCGLATDAAGNVYIADFNNNRIRRVGTNGNISTIAGSSSTAGYTGDNGQATSAQLNNPIDVTVDATGNVYIADYRNQVIRKVGTDGIITTYAGTGTAGYSGDGGAANAAQLNYSEGLAVDIAGNLYIDDNDNYRVRKVGSIALPTLTLGTGNNPTTCTGTEGSIAFTSSGYASTTQTLSYTKNSTATTASVNVGSDGSFALTGLGAGTYAGFAIGGTTASGSRTLTDPAAPTFTVGTLTHPTTYTGTNGSIPLTGLSNSTSYSLSYKKNGGAAVVSSITSSGSGTYTITGLGVGAYTEIKVTLNNCVSSTTTATLNSPTPVINTIAGTGVGGYSGTGGQAINAQLKNDANGLVVDAAGNLYIPEYYNHWVRRVATDGVIYVHAGRIDGNGYSEDNGPATSATLNNPRGVALDAVGNLYIADQFNHRLRKVTNGNISTIAGTGTGGTAGNGGLATAAQLNYPYDVAIDAAGNIYVSDYFNHLVRKIGTDGKINLFAGTGTAGFSGDAGAATSAQLNNPCGLATDAAGNVYIADFNNHRVRKVAPNGTISTFAGSSSVAGYAGDYGLATAAQLNNPIDMVVDASGNVYISDFANNRVRKVGTDGIITTFAGTGTGGYSGDGGAANAAQLSGPEGLAVDIAGNLYINDNFNKRVRKVGTNALPTLTLGSGSNPTTCTGTEGSIAFTSSGFASTTQTLSYTKNSTATTASVNVGSDGSFTLTGLGAGTYTGFAIGGTTASGGRTLTDPAAPTFTVGTLTHPTTYTGTDGSIPLTGLSNSTAYSLSYKKNGGTAVVSSITSSGSGTYTLSGLNAGTYAITLNGCTGTTATATLVGTITPTISTFAGTGSSNYSGDGGAATVANLSNPYAVVADASGNVYIADASSNRIRKVSPSGIISTVAGTGTAGYSGDGGLATEATLNSPYGVSLDASGNLYIVDRSNHAIRKVGTDGKISTIAGTGSFGFSGDGGLATSAQLSFPIDVAVDAAGNVYIADHLNQRIRKIGTDGKINTIVGTGTEGFSNDGVVATNAQLKNPQSVAVDASGNIYISDTGNHRVRKVGADGLLTTFIGGGGGAGFSGDNTPAFGSQVFNPLKVVIGTMGDVYVADYSNNRIRRVGTNGIITTFAGTGTAGFSGDGGAANAANINSPTGVAVDVLGNVYIADGSNARIRKVGTASFVTYSLTLGSGNNPTTCSGTDGSIAFTSLGYASTTQTLSYTKNSTATTASVNVGSDGSFTLTGLGAGTYTGFSIGSTTVSGSRTLEDPTAPTFTVGTVTNPTTCSGTDGSIPLTALANSTAYSLSYKKNGGAAVVASITSGNTGTYTISGLGAGEYTEIKVTLNGCISANKIATLTDPTYTLVAGAVTQPTTCGGTGSINFTTTLPSGTYTLNYKKDGAPQTSSFTIGGEDARISAELASGFLLSNIGAGSYSDFSITYLGCNVSTAGPVVLTDPTAPTFTVGTATNPTTCSGSDGSIPLTGLANSTVYSLSYKKNGGAAVVASITSGNTGIYTISGLGAGEYTEIKVTLNGCVSANKTATLANPNYTLVTGTVTQPTTCGGTGSIAFTTNLPSGTFTLNYKKDGAPQTSSFTIGGEDARISAELASGFLLSNIGAGIYSDFSVTHLGCNASTTGPVALNDPAAPTFTVGTQTNPAGCGTADGSIQLTGLANSTVYSLSYKKNGGDAVVASITTNGSGAYTISGLGAGAYTEIKVTLNGCVSTNKTATLTDPTYTLAAGTVNPPATCGGVGSINFTTTLPSGTYTLNYKKDGKPQTSSFTIGGDETRISAELASGFLLSNVGPGVYSDFSVSYGGCTIVGTGGNKTLAAPNSPAVFSVTGGGAYCAGGPGVLVGLSGSEVGVIYYFKNIESDGKAGTGSAISFGNQKAAGFYTVEAVNTTSNCKSMMTGSATVTVNTGAASGGLIVYNGSPFCANAGTANVTRTAAEGGTYSCETAGLSLNPTTGAVNLAASTPGTYLVRYTLASTCTYVNTTAYITVTSAPTATITYSNSPYCAGSGTATVTLTGKSGGVFSSTSGLSIDANTGAINLVATTAGSYVVTYTLAVANGCGEFKTTANVSITTKPSATIAYANSPYCANAGTATVTLTGSQGGTFSSTSGLSINANTGAINLAASTAGTYVVTYTIAAANGCSEFKTTANLSITAAPTASIAYSNTPYCANAGTVTVTLTGKTGGVFSSTSGLSIDANTGAINLATSTAGNYVVTYTIPAANGCGEFKTTANVAITTTPSATIAYANSPYCSNAGTESVTLTGSQGGTFSSSAGLSIDANTGAIDLSASTTGTYVVTYTIAAANGCSEFKTTTNVNITAAPTATIAYSSTPYCANAGTASVTLTGKTGGVFSSTSGLNIDANTGAINLATSTAGSYVVTYTIPAANGCDEFKTTVNVAITTTPTATIAYANSPYCSNAGTASVTLTGSQGGTFSSSAGLFIDANTGAVNLAASTAGTYVVTYTIAAVNGCAEFKTTANVSITAAPIATIAYSSTLYCANAGTASVTLTGKTGGVFSSTSGLSINASTGEINLATSSAGSYVVTYTIAAANGCGELKATANVTIQAVLVAPSILSNQSSSVCMGTEVLLYTNCPQGSTVLWSNNSTATVLALNANSPSSQILTAKCQQAGACTSAPSEPYKVEWLSTFSLTPINIGQSKSGLKPENSPKSAWSSQYILPDFGPALENSTESNPTIYYSENMNKTAPRYWTIHVETCNLGTAGSLTFNMLSKDESGVERSYNTHENNAPYLMYANRNGFTELYAQNHPAYGFYQDNGSGGNVYDAGLPKGLYKLGIRYWDQKGWGSIFPATRQPAGNVLAYQEFWFRIQSKDGVGKGAARVAAENGQLVTDNGLFAEVMPNPVSSILRLKVIDVKDQKVSVSLIDASGRTLLQRAFTPETNQHQEEFEVSELTNGMYFLKVNAGSKQATLKVVKVQ